MEENSGRMRETEERERERELEGSTQVKGSPTREKCQAGIAFLSHPNASGLAPTVVY